MKTIKCRCCDKDSKYEKKSGASFGEIKRETGWNIVLTYEMKSYYVCPECYEKLNCHANEIQNLIQDKNICFSYLLRDDR